VEGLVRKTGASLIIRRIPEAVPEKRGHEVPWLLDETASADEGKGLPSPEISYQTFKPSWVEM